MACRLLFEHYGKRTLSTCARNCREFKGHVVRSEKIYLRDMEGYGSKPIVCLLSWTGSSERDLAKYSAVYEDRGYTVIRNIVDYRSLLSLRSSSLLEKQAEYFIGMLRDNDLAKERLFVHLLSNGGFFLYDAITTQLKKHGNKDIGRIVGCILDSAPAQETLTRTAGLVTTTVPGPMAFRYAVGVTVSSVIRTAFWFRWLLKYIAGDHEHEPRIWHRMSKEPNSHPQLFLYSKADKLIDYEHIQRFAEERRKLGVSTSQRMWEDSPHVLHFRVHRDGYVAEVLNFLRACQQTKTPS